MSRDRHFSLKFRCSRRTLFGITATMATLCAVGAEPTLAQAPYPSKPIRLLVGFAPGGPTDIIARVIGAKLGDILGQQVYVENRPGASGNLATEAAARADGDGYTPPGELDHQRGEREPVHESQVQVRG